MIKEHFGQQPTVAAFTALARTLRVGDDALAAMEAQVRTRAASPARAAKR